MIMSLSIMALVDSEHETLGYGIGMILMNIGIYFVLPYGITLRKLFEPDAC